MPQARINLASTDIAKLNEICKSIVDIAEKTKTHISGPIPLPTQRLRHTVRKSPCGNGKASFDNFEMRIHKRLVYLGIDDRALRLVMRVPIPEGVQISIASVE
ncbi:MAG TPA: 30S ribosomal protein S10 [Candidatus Nanoarchaeia archaeon]|nr:30S ribosomal protein S10 [Candidatus Nanoarchaeia archaeon]